jgi:CRISPR-associated endoribonuclease Cas6
MMTRESRTHLEYLAISITVIATRSLRLNPWKGSLLRGIFGTYLKRQDLRVFSELFRGDVPKGGEHSHAPPYVLSCTDVRTEFSREDCLSFELILLAEATSFRDPILRALKEGLSNKGFAWGSHSVVEKVLTLPGDSGTEPIASVEILLVSPFRVKHFNSLAGALTWPLFYNALLRRLKMVFPQETTPIFQQYYESHLAEACGVCDIQSSWCEYTRRSTRQDSLLQIGGLVGAITLENVSPLLYHLLLLGTDLHIGKQVSFGLGKYELHTPVERTYYQLPVRINDNDASER